MRLPLVVNNSRLLVLPPCECPNLISRFMKLMLGRLSADWEQSWGHPVALAETFVDPHLYQGTAYKASGWHRLGQTGGWKRSAEDFYQKHERPKQIWVRELVPNACGKLCARQLPAQTKSPIAANAKIRLALRLPVIRCITLELSGRCGRERMIVAQATPQRSAWTNS